jgi:hypothetical protein
MTLVVKVKKMSDVGLEWDEVGGTTLSQSVANRTDQ